MGFDMGFSARLKTIVVACVVMWLSALGGAFATGQTSAPDGQNAVARAVAYLSVEVPRWRLEHPCYSCHNNGDATRALLAASANGHTIGDSLDDTLAWLATPARWDSNARRGGSEELPLARIQFATALVSMVAFGRATQDALDQAALLLIGHQQADGSFRLSETQILGGATFYGTSLATALARRVLARAKNDAAQAPLAKANAWLRNTTPATVLDASAILLGLERDGDDAAIAQRKRCLDMLKQGQGPDGGWGPYLTSQSEPFDTSLAMLSLIGLRNIEAIAIDPFSDRELRDAIRRGKAYLAEIQNADGSWPETTRPPNGESYAQRISTTAWSLQALLLAE